MQVLPMLRRIGLAALLIAVSLSVHAETDQIKEWQKQFFSHLQSHRRFPRQAMGETGTAKVGFVLDRQGDLVSHWLEESTGNRTLDEESLAILERAKPFPMPPSDRLTEDRITFTVPIIFRSRPALSGQESGAWDEEQARLRAKVNSICRGC
ncbi:energy transducer TonB family protein [Bradyrhizobium roseum]|uniref:energy transducer TonB family protein n=1 Tax=Bradyrhizobium roseum TaxID=3056648 RepID=UPI0026262B8C|nr:TonB family protein [Bradyrhizobium roseus]WKA29495.1 TonB family protein [Bradyrhizobium roseus]